MIYNLYHIGIGLKDILYPSRDRGAWGWPNGFFELVRVTSVGQSRWRSRLTSIQHNDTGPSNGDVLHLSGSFSASRHVGPSWYMQTLLTRSERHVIYNQQFISPPGLGRYRLQEVHPRSIVLPPVYCLGAIPTDLGLHNVFTWNIMYTKFRRILILLYISLNP